MNPTIITLTILYNLCCIALAYASLTAPAYKMSKLERRVVAFIFIASGTFITYSVWMTL